MNGEPICQWRSPLPEIRFAALANLDPPTGGGWAVN
jgi:hypothetical protein